MKKKVVLFNPAVTDTNHKLKVTPLSLLAISKLLYKNGYEIVLVSRFEDSYLEKLLREIDGAVCLGITAMTGYQIKNALDTAATVKKKFPHIKIVWGGWHASILPEQTVKHNLIDIIVYGQGERTFYELVEALRNRKAIGKIKGILYKHNGKIIKTPPRELENPDNFPSFPYELLDLKEYYINSEGSPRSLYYITSIGCPHRCGFCADKILYKRIWKALPAERVVDEIECLVKEQKVTGLFLGDNNFFVDEHRVVDICKGLIKKNIKIKLINVEGRADQLNRYSAETFALMERSGFHNFLIGAESLNQGTLDYVNKDETVDELYALVKKCKKYNIRLYLSFVIGFPPKDEEQRRNYSTLIKKEFYDILDYIDKLRAVDPRHYIGIYLYTPYPGTDLFNKDVENGFIPPSSLEEWMNIDMTHISTPWLPKKYKSLVDQVSTIYQLFLMGIVRESAYTIHKKSLFYRLAYQILNLTLSIRWKLRFFYIPIESLVLRFSIRINDS